MTDPSASADGIEVLAPAGFSLAVRDVKTNNRTAVIRCSHCGYWFPFVRGLFIGDEIGVNKSAALALVKQALEGK